MSKLKGILCVLCFCCAMLFYAHQSLARVCFLPNGECIDSITGDGLGSSSQFCEGFNLSSAKRGIGWHCEQCGSKYKCSCSTGYQLNNGSCVKHEGQCPDGEYRYSSSKDDMSNCSKCEDPSSRNSSKYKCECYDIIDDEGECVEDPCGPSEYSYSETDLGEMEEKGYTCRKCTYSYSNHFGYYDCRCDFPREIDDYGEKCVESKNCEQEGMFDDRASCENARNNALHTKCTEINGGYCYAITDYCVPRYAEFLTKEACLSVHREYSCNKKTEDGVCYLKGDLINDECNSTNYPYVKINSSDARRLGFTDWEDISIFAYLNSIGSVYAAHKDHFEGPFDSEIYNKIATNSASCTDSDNKVRYKNICDGIPEDRCNVGGSVSFVANGCVSEGYEFYRYNGVKKYNPQGTKWGECKKDCSAYGSGYYTTDDECEQDNSGKVCILDSSNTKCHITCEKAGYYSSKQDCESGITGECVIDGGCYRRNTFKIRYKPGQQFVEYVSCPYATSMQWRAFITKDINGNNITYYNLEDRITYEYPAGTYDICVQAYGECSGIDIQIDRTRIIGYNIDTDGNPSYGYTPGGSYCFSDREISGCDKSERMVGANNQGYSCHKYQLKAGYIYEIEAKVEYMK